MSHHDPIPDPKPGKLSAWGCLAIVGVILLVFCGGGLATVMVVHQGNKARLAATMEELRSSGAPIDGASLAKLHAVPADVTDLTNRYVAVLDHYRGPANLAPQFAVLPIVGTSAGPMPARDQPWNELELAETYLAARPWMAELDDLGATDGAVAFSLEFKDGYHMVLENAQLIRGVARDLKLRFHVQMRRGDRAGALKSIVATVGASRCVERDPALVSQLVRVAVDGMAMEQAREFLRDGKATPEEIAALRRAFQGGYHDGLIRALEGERGSACVSLDSMNLDELNGMMGPNPGGSPATPLGKMGKVSELMPGDTEHLIRFQTKMVEAAKAPTFHDARAAMVQVDAQLKAEIGKNSGMPWNRRVLAAQLLPAIDAATNAMGRGETMRRAMRATLDLEEHLAGLPENERTVEHVKTFLDERLALPEFADPFNGKPMLHKIAPESVTIYAVGENGADDGGDIDMTNRRAPDYGIKVERPLGD